MTSQLQTTAHRIEMLSRLIAPDLVEIGADGRPRLMGGRCRSCGVTIFPRAAVCTGCLGEDIDSVPLGSRGVLYSFSVIHQAPKGWNVPYTLGYVDLPDGVRVLAHIAATAGELAIDLPVQLETGIVGSDEAGSPMASYIFVPQEKP